MNKQEYENKKRECWEEFCQHIVDEEEAFYNMFDKAYALGKQEKESKSMQLSDVKRKIDAWMESHTEEEVYELLKKYGAVEDAEKTVIQGWVARDSSGFISLFSYLPKRSTHTNVGYWGCDDGRDEIDLPKSLFPDLTWKEDPIEVELIIKRKKKTENQ